MEKMARVVFGQSSEKMLPPAEELRREAPRRSRDAEKEKRRLQAEAKAALPTREILHRVPGEARRCPSCHSTSLKTLGKGRVSVVYEYVPGHFERHVHVQETLSCTCGEGVVTAPGPTRVAQQCGYGPGFLAHIVTAKCADSLPLHRLEKALARDGIPMSRSTLTDLFHTAAREVEPLVQCLLSAVARQSVVHADETPLKVQAPEKCKVGYLWTFLADDDGTEDALVAYRFSPSRAGSTPAEVLGGTTGALVVDTYTGYNRVTTPDGRTRVGCWAHARRRFHEARSSAPEAYEILALILDFYRVEAFAKSAGLTRSPAHLKLRQEKSAQTIDSIRGWLDTQAPLHLPRSPMGEAIRYAQN